MPDSPISQPKSAFVCDCEEWMRFACAGGPFNKMHDGKRYCVLHFPGKEKSADFKKALQRKLETENFDFRGVWFPDEVLFVKFDFTAGADFSDATFSAGADFSYATFSAPGDFRSATFSAEVSFYLATFGAEANFSGATFSAVAGFSGATFNTETYFTGATFSAWADFSDATFSAGADFSYATFSALGDFRSATFNEAAIFTSATFTTKAYFFSATFGAAAIFSRATFEDANLAFAIFSAVASFNEAIFRNYVEFAGKENRKSFSTNSSLDLQFATIEKPDRVLFHTLTLHPHWFVNVDSRKFDFTNVKWENSGEARPELELLKAKRDGYVEPDQETDGYVEPDQETDADVEPDQETKAKSDDADKSSHRLLSQSCQRLAANSEENSRYREASDFRRMSMDAERLATWHGFDVRKSNWWYWLASGYGERPFQALMVLVAILVLFGALYTQVGFARWEPRLASKEDVATAKKDEVGAPLPFSRALSYSAGVMTLQKPEPKPRQPPRKRLCFWKLFLDRCKLLCSRWPFAANSCAEDPGQLASRLCRPMCGKALPYRVCQFS